MHPPSSRPNHAILFHEAHHRLVSSHAQPFAFATAPHLIHGKAPAVFWTSTTLTRHPLTLPCTLGRSFYPLLGLRQHVRHLVGLRTLGARGAERRRSMSIEFSEKFSFVITSLLRPDVASSVLIPMPNYPRTIPTTPYNLLTPPTNNP